MKRHAERWALQLYQTSLTWLLKTLKQEFESAVSWFNQNEMIINADKFQATILNKKVSEAKYKLTIDNNNIESTKSVKLLGITIADLINALKSTIWSML